MLGVLAHDRGGQRRPVGLGGGPRDDPVVGRRRLHGVGPLARRDEGQPAAHAVADHADAGLAAALLQHVDRTRQVLGRGGQVQAHHELAGAVGLGGRLAVVEVGRQGGEALGGEAVGDLLDVGDESPPLLQHEHTGPAPVGQVAVGRGPVGLERDHLTHAADGSRPTAPTFTRTGTAVGSRRWPSGTGS